MTDTSNTVHQVMTDTTNTVHQVMTDTTNTVHHMVLSCDCSKPSTCIASKCVTHLENAIDVSLWVKGDRVEIDNQQLGEPVDDRQP